MQDAPTNAIGGLDQRVTVVLRCQRPLNPWRFGEMSFLSRRNVLVFSLMFLLTSNASPLPGKSSCLVLREVL